MLIKGLSDLAAHLGCAATATSISRRLYKDTECGISFALVPGGVMVAGYAEGVDAECQPYELLFPFTDEAFDQAVENADAEGCLLFNENHCERCGAEVPTSECDCIPCTKDALVQGGECNCENCVSERDEDWGY